MHHDKVDYTNLLRNYFMQGESQNYAKGEMLLAADSVPNAVFYIATGYIKAYSMNSRNEQFTHIVCGPGEIYPLVWLTQKIRHNMLFESMTAAETYCIPLTKAINDLENDSKLSFAMMLQAIEQYRTYGMRVDNLEYKYASERLAYQLVLLANRFGEHSGDSITIVPPMTHQLLGSSLNLSRESVSREMEKLLRKGLVRYNASRQIIIPDIVTLASQLKVPLYQGLSSSSEEAIN